MDSVRGFGKIGTIESTCFGACWNRVSPAGVGREGLMKIGKRLPVFVAAAALLAGVSLPARAQQQKDTEAIAIGERAGVPVDVIHLKLIFNTTI